MAYHLHEKENKVAKPYGGYWGSGGFLYPNNVTGEAMTDERAKNTKLKAALFQRGMSQVKLAELTSIPPSYVSMGLNGKFIFTPSQKAKIAESLNIPADQIFE